MKPTLAVLGDSYMRPDAAYPGLHFSEHLEDYDVRIYAQDGASMGMIAFQFARARTDDMQAFVIGLGAHDRLEFWAGEDHGDLGQQRLWYCGNRHSLATREQSDTALMYQIHACAGMSNYKALLIAKSMFLELEKHKIPFAWSYSMAAIHDTHSFHWLLASVLRDFENRSPELNLADYRPFVSSPGFHVSDPSWQKQFSDQCLNILRERS